MKLTTSLVIFGSIASACAASQVAPQPAETSSQLPILSQLLAHVPACGSRATDSTAAPHPMFCRNGAGELEHQACFGARKGVRAPLACTALEWKSARGLRLVLPDAAVQIGATGDVEAVMLALMDPEGGQKLLSGSTGSTESKQLAEDSKQSDDALAMQSKSAGPSPIQAPVHTPESALKLSTGPSVSASKDGGPGDNALTQVEDFPMAPAVSPVQVPVSKDGASGLPAGAMPGSDSLMMTPLPMDLPMGNSTQNLPLNGTINHTPSNSLNQTLNPTLGNSSAPIVPAPMLTNPTESAESPEVAFISAASVSQRPALASLILGAGVMVMASLF